MTCKLRLLAVTLVFLLRVSAAPAQASIVVYPNPIQFGTVSLNATSYPQTIFVSNTSNNGITVTSMMVTGANSSDFAFYGPTCVGLISSQQTCEMSLTFTPAVESSISASLVITVAGSSTPVTIPLLGTGGNPIPTVTSLSPPTVYAGSSGITLTVNGSSFLPSSVVYLNNSPLPTTYKSSTQLTALVPGSDLLQNYELNIGVVNPPPGGGGSTVIPLQVVALDPTLSDVSPSSLVAGAAATPIVLNGNNFMSGATVLWNGTPLPATYVSASQLQVQLKAAYFLRPEIVQLAVSNPAPGGVSTPVTFNVTYPATVRILNIPANDLAWDPYAQRIYASVPSSYGSDGNTIAVINPTSGGVAGYYFAGSEPTKLALSNDGEYLYTGLNGDGSVQRLIVPAFTPDINVSLGTSEYGGVNTANDLKVSPGDSHTFAVTLNSGCCGNSPLQFFKDASLLADSVTSASISYIQFASASTLFGYSGGGTVSDVSVDASGGKLTTEWNDLITGYGDIQYDAGLIYGSGGQVLNPETGDLVGTYDVGGQYENSNFLLPESAINSVFLIGNSPFFSALGITSYNLSHFTPNAVVNLSQINGSAAHSFISWGYNGLAFVSESDCCGSESYQVVIVQSSMMQPVSTTKNPAPVPASLSPANTLHGGGNFQLTINGSGFVPGSEVTWNGALKTVSYVSPTQLIVYVPASNIVSAGSASIVVTNPTPGGGKSTALTFPIN